MFRRMDLRKASRDPWVWGQVALVALVAVLAPLLPRYVNLGNADYALNRVDPTWIRALGGLMAAVGLVALQYFDAKARAEERWLIERYPEYQRYARYVRRRVL